MDGLPLDEVSTMFSLLRPVAFPSYLLLAEKKGIPWTIRIAQEWEACRGGRRLPSRQFHADYHGILPGKGDDRPE